MAGSAEGRLGALFGVGVNVGVISGQSPPPGVEDVSNIIDILQLLNEAGSGALAEIGNMRRDRKREAAVCVNYGGNWR